MFWKVRSSRAKSSKNQHTSDSRRFDVEIYRKSWAPWRNNTHRWDGHFVSLFLPLGSKQRNAHLLLQRHTVHSSVQWNVWKVHEGAHCGSNKRGGVRQFICLCIVAMRQRTFSRRTTTKHSQTTIMCDFLRFPFSGWKVSRSDFHSSSTPKHLGCNHNRHSSVLCAISSWDVRANIIFTLEKCKLKKLEETSVGGEGSKGDVLQEATLSISTKEYAKTTRYPR